MGEVLRLPKGHTEARMGSSPGFGKPEYSDRQGEVGCISGLRFQSGFDLGLPSSMGLRTSG